ncbi:MAG: hypothetical protein DMG45_00360 [Acidobacteria bacterium]|nr:MAG: hypothetical protein DME24_22470 [Verrucomicrobiota bacterium]PYT46107.1 MAG: hypothetical protein DMG45_00360 [Acidobacteriota bacterium]
MLRAPRVRDNEPLTADHGQTNRILWKPRTSWLQTVAAVCEEGEDFRSAGLRPAADSQVADPCRERPRVYLNRKILLSASIKERTGVHESVELEYRSPL